MFPCDWLVRKDSRPRSHGVVHHVESWTQCPKQKAFLFTCKLALKFRAGHATILPRQRDNWPCCPGWPEHRQRCTGPRGRPGTKLSTERTADDDLVSQEKWGCYKTGADKRIYLPAASKMTINKVRSAITVLSTFRAKHEPVSGSQGSEYELEPSPMCLAPQNCQINQ